MFCVCKLRVFNKIHTIMTKLSIPWKGTREPFLYCCYVLPSETNGFFGPPEATTLSFGETATLRAGPGSALYLRRAIVTVRCDACGCGHRVFFFPAIPGRKLLVNQVWIQGCFLSYIFQCKVQLLPTPVKSESETGE